MIIKYYKLQITLNNIDQHTALNKIINIPYKSSCEDMPELKNATPYSAGLDLYSAEDIIVRPISECHKTTFVNTGISMAIQNNYVGFLCSRSGISVKHCLSLVNGIGIIDSDYRGEIKFGIINNSNEKYHISKFDRIGQILIIPYITEEIIDNIAIKHAFSFNLVKSLDDTTRGTGGFGSTGK